MKELRRVFIPGGQWSYFKVYSGNKTADLIIKNALLAIADSLLRDDIITKWFFICYSDPDLHIRIRFYLFEQNKGPHIHHVQNIATVY